MERVNSHLGYGLLEHVNTNTFSDPQSIFHERPDNGKIQLNISCSLTNQYLCDTTGTGYNFRRHVAKEWP